MLRRVKFVEYDFLQLRVTEHVNLNHAYLGYMWMWLHEWDISFLFFILFGEVIFKGTQIYMLDFVMAVECYGCKDDDV